VVWLVFLLWGGVLWRWVVFGFLVFVVGGCGVGVFGGVFYLCCW